MLELARRSLMHSGCNGRLELRLVNVERSGLATGVADVVTCGYALRNVDSLANVFREMHRVLKPGGRVVLLELSVPENRLLRRGFWLYMDRILPVVSMPLVRARGPLRYLSASVKGFRAPEEVLAELRGVGFERVRRCSVLYGVCSIYLAQKGHASQESGNGDEAARCAS